MARAADFRMTCGFRRHPKVIKLSRKLGSDGVLSWISLISFCAQYRTDGSLGEMDAEEIAIASDWSGDPQLFVNTLQEIGLLDESSEGVLSIHDWTEHNPFAAGFEQRSERARRASAARWGDNEPDGENPPRTPKSAREAHEAHCETGSAAESAPHLNGDAERNAVSDATGNAASIPSSNAPFPPPSLSETDSAASSASASASRLGAVSAYPGEFLKFWQSFPRKDCKREALKAWQKLTPELRLIASEDVPKRILANWADRETSKIPHAATYLNQRQWEDDLLKNRPAAAALFSPKKQQLLESIQLDRAREVSDGTFAGQTGLAQGQHDLDNPADRRECAS